MWRKAYDDEAVRTEVTSESLMLEVPTIRLGWLPLKSTPVTTPVVSVEAATKLPSAALAVRVML